MAGKEVNWKWVAMEMAKEIRKDPDDPGDYEYAHKCNCSSGKCRAMAHYNRALSREKANKARKPLTGEEEA